MNKAMFDQMMQRLGSSGSMLPPPGDFAPGGAMFAVDKPSEEDQAKINAYQPTSMLGKVGKLIAPQTATTIAGKGGAG